MIRFIAAAFAACLVAAPLAGAAFAQGAQKAAARTPAAALAPAWTVDPRNSRVTVSEDTTGLSFTFDAWTADLRFDPANLPGSRATVTLQTSSARTGDATNDAALRNDWVKARQHPTATFQAASFRSLGGSNYEAPGQLTIQGRTYPIVFRFSAVITGNQAQVTGRSQLDRAAMGFSLDPNFDWVSRMVNVNVSLRATRAG